MKARRLLIAVIAVGALVAAGCGGDRGEDESGGTDTTATDSTEAAAGGPGDFGDLTDVCGPNEGGGAVADDPAETQGVTADSITLGTVSDPGFEGRPGLNIELHRRRPGLRRVVQRRGRHQRQDHRDQPPRRRDHRVPTGAPGRL